MGVAAAPLAIASLVGTAGSTILGVAGQQAETKAETAAANFRAEVARNNLAIARQRAEDAIQRGRVQEENLRFLTEQEIGASRVSAAARGVEVDTGSPADILRNLAARGEQDALTIRANAAREAFEQQQLGRQFEEEARLAEFEGRFARRAGRLRTAGTVLGGATSVSSKWYQFNQAGVI